MQAVRDAAEGLEGNGACTAQHGMEIAVEALGTLWIAHLLGWWTKSTLREVRFTRAALTHFKR